VPVGSFGVYYITTVILSTSTYSERRQECNRHRNAFLSVRRPSYWEDIPMLGWRSLTLNRARRQLPLYLLYMFSTSYPTSS
jgi:hypothetical protein